MDMKRVSQSLQRSPNRRSPNHDDPAAVLWSNYAEKRGNEPILPPLPPLELSPRTPHAAAKDSSFRRTASCGNEWPTSSSKRRKLKHHDPHSTTKQIFASKRREMLKPELSKQSKVSLLLDSVQQNLAMRRQNQDEPSSSSPLPERFEPEGLEEAVDVCRKACSPSPRRAIPTNVMATHGSSPLKNQGDKSSDYGELDFDDDDLEGIEDALTQGHAQIQAASDLPALRHADTIQPSCIGISGLVQQPQTQEATKACKQELSPWEQDAKAFDEFDDDNDDIFDNELQQLAEKVELQAGLPIDSRPENSGQRKTGMRNEAPNMTAMVNACDGAFDDDELWDEEIDEQALNTAHDALQSGKQVRRFP